MPRIMEWPREWNDFARVTFFLGSLNLSSRSPFTGRLSVSGPTAQLWRAEVTMAPQQPELWMEIEGFVAEASGQAGLIRFYDPAQIIPQRDRIDAASSAPDEVPWSDSTFFDDGSGWVSGQISPTVYVTAAAARGETSAIIGGLPASESRVLRRGDKIEFRRNGIADETPSLHIVVRDAPTNSSGEALVEFRPALRKGVAAGDMVVTQYPMSVFRFVDNDQGMVERSPYLTGDIGFKLIEAII